MAMPPEPPTRRFRRAPRTFSATTGELEEIIAVLHAAHATLTAEIAAEEKKPAKKRVAVADLQRMLERAHLLARAAREMRA